MSPKKFRAWHKVDGWCGAFSVHMTGLVRTGDSEPIWQTPEEANIVLMQSTGLTDKNGKEIYEGDILKRTDENHIGKVSWKYGGFIVSLRGNGSHYIRGVYDDDIMYEIIGNIYENPDLLK